mgnify:CR=1 FL=1
MTTTTNTLSPGECPIKTPPRVVVENAVPLPSLKKYFRTELRLSKRDAEYMAREVYRDEATSRTNLPEAWHTDIWPETVTFTRRTPGVSDPTPVKAFKNIELEKLAA